LGLVVVIAAVVYLSGRGVEVRTPDDVAAGKLAGRVRDEHVRRDHAWPQYFAAQALLDLGTVADRARTAVRLIWTQPQAWLSRWEMGLWWPLWVPVTTAKLACSAGAALGVTLTATV